MVTIVVDDHIPFIKGVLEPFVKVIYAAGGQIGHDLASKADGLIIRTRTICNASLLEGTPVRFIATATIGHDHIDTAYCSENDIAWHHAPGCNAASVKQYMASALVTLASKHNFDLTGKKIGIIGAGHVGSKVARFVEALGMMPLLNDPPRERNEKHFSFHSLEEISETCEIITFHVPLNYMGIDKTYQLASESFFAHLKKKPLIINTSRGPVVASSAVMNAARKGIISGFSADVWENEPFPDRELIEIADIATPHIAGYSVEGKANGTAACIRAASRHFGLGIDDWFPSSLPLPADPVIKIDAQGKTDQQLISQAILATYDILNDDALFRKDTEQFENLRNHYPVRREFEAYRLNIINERPGLLEALQKIGFII